MNDEQPRFGSATRVELVDRLRANLSDDQQMEIANEWAEELERRLADFEAGRMVAISGEEAIRTLIEKYRVQR